MPTIAKSAEIVPGQMTSIDLQGTRVAVANIGGTFYAFTDTCPHAGCSLAEGQLDGMTVTCRCHGSQFDIATGHVVTGPARDRVRTYRVQVENGELRI